MTTEDNDESGFEVAPIGCETGEPMGTDAPAAPPTIGAIECTRQESLDVNRKVDEADHLRWFSVSKFTDGEVSLSFHQLGSSTTVHVTAEHAAALGRLLIEVAK